MCILYLYAYACGLWFCTFVVTHDMYTLYLLYMYLNVPSYYLYFVLNINLRNIYLQYKPQK